MPIYYVTRVYLVYTILCRRNVSFGNVLEVSILSDTDFKRQCGWQPKRREAGILCPEKTDIFQSTWPRYHDRVYWALFYRGGNRYVLGCSVRVIRYQPVMPIINICESHSRWASTTLCSLSADWESSTTERGCQPCSVKSANSYLEQKKLTIFNFSFAPFVPVWEIGLVLSRPAVSMSISIPNPEAESGGSFL